MFEFTTQAIAGSPTMGAAAAFLGGTFGLAAMRVLWDVTARRPARVNRHLTGRQATVYWHRPDGLQVERGITERARLRATGGRV